MVSIPGLTADVESWKELSIDLETNKLLRHFAHMVES